MTIEQPSDRHRPHPMRGLAPSGTGPNLPGRIRRLPYFRAGRQRQREAQQGQSAARPMRTDHRCLGGAQSRCCHRPPQRITGTSTPSPRYGQPPGRPGSHRLSCRTGNLSPLPHNPSSRRSDLPTGRTAKQRCFLQCCRCQQRIPTCLRKGLVIQPVGHAVTPSFRVAVRRVIL